MHQLLPQFAHSGHGLYTLLNSLPASVDGTTGPSHGGPVEYIALPLLVLQLALAHRYFTRHHPDGAHPGRIAILMGLAAMWAVSAASLVLTWSGVFYKSSPIPAGYRAAFVAIGYFWIALSSASLVIVVALRSLLLRIPNLHSPTRRRLLGAAGVVAFCVPAAATAFGVFVVRKDYGVTELDLPIAGLHPDFEGFRIAQVSDLHVSPFLSVRDAARVIDMTNELRADLALFTGDLITERGDPLDEAIRELIRLRAGYGVFGCMGNHEEYVGCRNYLQQQAGRAGLTFLRGAATQIRRGQGVLNIAGVDYQRTGNRGTYLHHTERLVIPDVPNILLSHNPDVFPVAIRRGFQAVIGGHTHGGQVNVEILHQNITPVRFKTPYISGLYREENASCFVTNGIGTIGMPIRLGAPPEVALLRLVRA